MPLQDRQEFQEWIAARQRRESAVHVPRGERTKCTGCGIGADEQKLIGAYCIECLAFNYGAESVERQLARICQVVAKTLVGSSPEDAHRLVGHILHRMDNVLEDLEDERQ